MYSKYFKIEINIPEQTIISSGEEVRIIPHAVLEDIIYNSEIAISKNITVHYTPIATNEPIHYACLCSISDSSGRRTESVGESLDDTLDTVIARNYPVLMAYKRAFDDAAIKYLGLDGKVYSDQQINKRTESKSKVVSNIIASDFTRDNNSEWSEPIQETPKIVKRANSTVTYSKQSPPIQKKKQPKKYGKKCEPVNVNVSNEFIDNNNSDEFDSILECSRIKEIITVRQAYKKYPDIVHWCANQMRVYSQVDEINQARCQRYIKLMEGNN